MSTAPPSSSSSSNNNSNSSSSVHSTSENALEGFCVLLKSSSGTGCIMVLKQILKHPLIFVFGEVLQVPSIIELEQSEHKQWVDLIRIFAYGRWADYKARESSLPPLGRVESTKLKQLTLVSLAEQNKTLAYSDLQRELDIGNVRELEDLIIECMYVGLLQGKLDQRNSCFHCTFTIGRDIGPHDVTHMLNRLQQWVNASNLLIRQLQNSLSDTAITVEQREKLQHDEILKKKDLIEYMKNERDKGQSEAAILNHMGISTRSLGNLSGTGSFDEKDGRASAKRRAKGGLRSFFR